MKLKTQVTHCLRSSYLLARCGLNYLFIFAEIQTKEKCRQVETNKFNVVNIN